MRIDINPSVITTTPAKKVSFAVTVHNDTTVIAAYRVTMLGVDPSWVTTDHDALSLFPDQTRTLTVTLAVPPNYPAGRRELAIQVTSLNDTSEFALTQVALEVEPVITVGFELEPTMAMGGKRTTFSVVVANTGNTRLDLVPTLVDDEEICLADFDPPTLGLEPSEQRIVEARVIGKRPWLVSPAVRTLHFSLDGMEAPPQKVATFMQRPRIGRWLLSLLGLMAAAAVFATVISRSFGNVIDEAKVDPAIIESALTQPTPEGGGAGSGSATDVVVAPMIEGAVTIRGTTTGISGATIELFAEDDALLPVTTAATQTDGSFSIPGLKDGSYKLRIAAAGFGESWHERASSFEAASAVAVKQGDPNPDLTIELGGEPGSIRGTVVADDPSGAEVRIVVQGELVGSILDPEIAAVEVSATGAFEFVDIPAPATYEIIVTRPGSAIERRIISLAGGEQRGRVEIVLFGGDGRISGSVSANGAPLGGVTVTATDGTATFQTVSLTTAGDLGDYVLRELATPGTYTITFDRPGYVPASQTLTLTEGSTAEGVNIVLTEAAGLINGTAFTLPVGADSTTVPTPTGGITVTATNGPDTFVTTTLSQAVADAPIGSYRFDDIPTPGVYTLTFSRDGLVSQTRSVNVDAEVSGVDATLSPASAVLRGLVQGALSAPGVVPVRSAPTGGVRITMTDGANSFATTSANVPTGRYEIAGVPPGTYTVTFDRPGSLAITQLVSLGAGEIEVLDVVIGRQALISGTVRSENGPFPGAGVRLFLVEDFPAGDPLATTITATNGTYLFPELDAPQAYVVVFASTPNGPAVDSVTIELDPGEQAENVDGLL